MKKLILIAVVAVLLIGGTIGAIAVFNSPKQVAARAVGSMLDDLIAREEIAPMMNVLTRGSVEFSLDGTQKFGGGEAIAASGKIYFSDKAVMLDDLSLTSDDLMLQGDLYYSEDLIYVENRDILNGAWGLEKGNLADEWKDSIFAPESGGELALDQTTFDLVSEILTALDEDVDEQLTEDMEKLVNRYAKKNWKLVGK